MNKAFIDAVDKLEKEKDVPKEVIFDAIEQALISAYKKNYGTSQNVRVEIDKEEGDIDVFMQKDVVEEVEDDSTQISIDDAREIDSRYETKSVCIDDYDFAYCKGCRSCHTTAKCVMEDDSQKLMAEIDDADIIVSVAPSYWADIPGQFKAFIDRCTPWCNTHEPHATVRSGKKGYAVALRTGPGMHECERIIGSIEHYYGHLEIECTAHLGLTSVEYKEDLEPRMDEILKFAASI